MASAADIVTLVVYGAFVAVLIYISYQDQKTRRISLVSLIVLAGLWLTWMVVLMIMWLIAGIPFGEIFVTTAPFGGMSFFKGLISGIIFGVVSLVFTLVFESATGGFGMGGGDIKLIAVTALFMGWERELVAILLACIIALIQNRFMQKKPQRRNSSHRESRVSQQTFAFGPAICAGCSIMLVLGMVGA